MNTFCHRHLGASERSGRIVVGVLLGALLGSLVGLLEGAHEIRAAAMTQRYGYASDTEDDEPLVTWPLLGLVAGAIGGSGAGRLYHGLRRPRGQGRAPW
jgi:hypothetical protein